MNGSLLRAQTILKEAGYTLLRDERIEAERLPTLLQWWSGSKGVVILQSAEGSESGVQSYVSWGHGTTFNDFEEALRDNIRAMSPLNNRKERNMSNLKTDRYEVVVGNIGTVHTGNNKRKATAVFNSYVRDSERGYGRAAGEHVTMFIVTGKDVFVEREYILDHWFPVSDLVKLLKSLKKDIGDEYRASDDPDDTTPGMCVTISTDDGTEWAFQTGSNSFSGGCYGHRHWAVVYLYRRSNCEKLAQEAYEELKDLVAREVE